MNNIPNPVRELSFDKRSERLVIVTHVSHTNRAGRIYAYTPYAREVEVWADLFAQVVIAAPCRDADPGEETAAIERSNVSLAPQIEFSTSRLRQLFQLPSATVRLVPTLL
jgi:hypothetical protein